MAIISASSRGSRKGFCPPRRQSMCLVGTAIIFCAVGLMHLSDGTYTSTPALLVMTDEMLGTTTSATKEGLNGALIIRSQFNKLPDKKLRGLYGLWTMTPPSHQDFAVDAVRKINEQGVEGDIVECGVWKGGMTMAMVFENMKNNIDRHIWLFDTYEGLPEPSHEKDDPRAKRLFKNIQEGKETPIIKGLKRTRDLEDGKLNYGPFDIVKSNMLYTGYPESNIHYVKGKVEDTLPVTKLPDKIAILRLDTDWYDSTKAELDYLYERLQPGGVLIIDDFCNWKGSKNAVIDYFKEKLNLDANEIARKPPCLNYWKPKL